ADEVVATLRRLLDAQRFEECGGHPVAAFRPRPEGLPEQDVGVLVRLDALAEPLVEGGLVVEVAVLVERAGDVGRLLAEREFGLGLLRLVAGGGLRDQEPEQQQRCPEKPHDCVPFFIGLSGSGRRPSSSRESCCSQNTDESRSRTTVSLSGPPCLRSLM